MQSIPALAAAFQHAKVIAPKHMCNYTHVSCMRVNPACVAELVADLELKVLIPMLKPDM
jgi:hypothetical protein